MPFIAKRNQNYGRVFHGCICCPRAGGTRKWREKNQDILLLMGKTACANCEGRGCRNCRSRAA